MRRLILVAGALAIAAGALAFVAAGVAAAGQDFADVQDANAREILKRSRQAVGGFDALARLQSLLLTGTSQIPSDRGLVTCDVEIRILLPDHYLRIDSAPFGEKRAGFQGKTVLSAINERGRTMFPPEQLKDEILESERVRMLQLMLGAATYVSTQNTVTFKSVAGGLSTFQAQATAEAAAQKAAAQRAWEAAGNAGQPPPSQDGTQTFAATYPDPYIVDVSLRDGGARFRLTLERGTYLPARLAYANANGDEVRITFSERRLTDGLNLPYRITTTSRGQVIDDLLLDQIDVNPGLTKADFRR